MTREINKTFINFITANQLSLLAKATLTGTRPPLGGNRGLEKAKAKKRQSS